MAVQYGKDAKLYYGSTEYAVTNVSIEDKTDVVDLTTTKSGGWRQRGSALNDFSGSFDLFYDDTLGLDTATIKRGSVAALKVSYSVDGTKYRAGYVIIESVSCPVDVATEMKFTINFQGTSPLSGTL
jgi:hypothetical protein